MATTTAEAIRDRARTVIKALTPTSLSRDKFREFDNEQNGDFVGYVEKTPLFRLFQVRTTGSDRPVEVSNTDVESHYIDLTVMVAYPQNSRAGKNNTLDRDDVMDQDRHLIEGAIGLRGYANFAGSNPNATWIEGSVERQSAGGVDFLVIKQTMLYYRAMT